MHLEKPPQSEMMHSYPGILAYFAMCAFNRLFKYIFLQTVMHYRDLTSFEIIRVINLDLAVSSIMRSLVVNIGCDKMLIGSFLGVILLKQVFI